MGVGQTKSNAKVDITTLAEYWSCPPTSQALDCGPLLVLQTFWEQRAVLPESADCEKKRVIVLDPASEPLD